MLILFKSSKFYEFLPSFQCKQGIPNLILNNHRAILLLVTHKKVYMLLREDLLLRQNQEAMDFGKDGEFSAFFSCAKWVSFFISKFQFKTLGNRISFFSVGTFNPSLI